MNVPRYRKGSIPITNPFGNTDDAHVDIPKTSRSVSDYNHTSKSPDLSFSKYASAIQQGLHMDNIYKPLDYHGNDGNIDPYLQNNTSPTETLHVQNNIVDTKPINPTPNINHGNIYKPFMTQIMSNVSPVTNLITSSNILTLFSPPPIQKSDNNEDERELMEELGIDFNDVYNMFKGVILFQKMDRNTLNDADMFGPICILILFGISLMLSGRLTFSLLYAIAVFGSICIYIILNCISQDVYIDLYTTMIILGYSTLPIVPLPIMYNALRYIWIGFGALSFIISLLWSTAIASIFFETIMYMANKRFMIAYPTLLFFTYFSFVAIL